MVRTAILTLWLLALSAPAALAYPGQGRRRRHSRRDDRPGRHEGRLHPDHRVPDPDRAAPVAAPEPAREAQGPPPRGGQGPPRARRPPRRLVIRYERRGSAALVTIDRPERHNAIDGPTARALLRGLRPLRRRRRRRTCSSSPARATQAFCAGADLKALETLDPDAPGGPLGFTRLASPKPTIAAISGHCLAGGFELALWCDLRVATTTATFGCAERRWGVPLIDGGTQRLPRIVGTGRALDLILTGRTIDAHEAHAIGLVTEIADPAPRRARARARRARSPPTRATPPTATAAPCSTARGCRSTRASRSRPRSAASGSATALEGARRFAASATPSPNRVSDCRAYEEDSSFSHSPSPRSAARRRRGRHLPRLQLRRRRQDLGQQRLEAVRRHRRRGRGHELHRRHRR